MKKAKKQDLSFRKRLKRFFFNDEYYHNFALRLKITRFLLWQLHILIAFCMVLYNKIVPIKRPLRILEPGLVQKILGSSWKYSLASVMHKIEEGYYYRKVNPTSPSLEIGSGSCVTSLCFFYDRQIDIASDIGNCLPFINQIPLFRIFKHVIRLDAHRIPFKEESLQDIVMVHIVDHLPDLATLLTEISRVLKEGGSFYFSGYSIYWKKLLGSKPDNKIPVFNSYHYNLFDENGWAELLNQYGMCLEDYGYFLTGKMARFYRLTRFLFHARRAGLDIIGRIPLLDRWYEEMLLNLFIPLCERDLQRCKKQNNGIHIWLHARKMDKPPGMGCNE